MVAKTKGRKPAKAVDESAANWGAIKIAKLEVVKINGHAMKSDAAKAISNQWREMSQTCAEVANFIWQDWMLWHAANGSREIVMADNARTIAWHKLKDDNDQAIQLWLKADRKSRGPKPVFKAEKPKWVFKPVDERWSKSLYLKLAARFPHLHTRVVNLIQNKIVPGIGSRKAAHGSIGGAASILLYRERWPHFTEGLPIPFDRCNGPQDEPIRAPEGERKNYLLKLRLAREKVEGKKICPSICYDVELFTCHKNIRSQAESLAKCITGEYKFAGSSLVYDDSKRKWFAHVAFFQPAGALNALDVGNVATLTPCGLHERHPWRLAVPGCENDRWPGMWISKSVGSVRQRIFWRRRTTAGHYRWAGSAAKGHGRNRAQSAFFKLSNAWKGYVKNANHGMANDIIAQCVRYGCGTLVYQQPEAELQDELFLSAAGKQPNAKDSTGWDWFQMRTFLEQKGQKAGIAVKIVKLTKQREERKKDGEAA